MKKSFAQHRFSLFSRVTTKGSPGSVVTPSPLKNKFATLVFRGSHRVQPQLWANRQRLWANRQRLWANRQRLWANRQRLWANRQRLWANRQRLWASRQRLWANRFDVDLRWRGRHPPDCSGWQEGRRAGVPLVGCAFGLLCHCFPGACTAIRMPKGQACFAADVAGHVHPWVTGPGAHNPRPVCACGGGCAAPCALKGKGLESVGRRWRGCAPMPRKAPLLRAGHVLLRSAAVGGPHGRRAPVPKPQRGRGGGGHSGPDFVGGVPFRRCLCIGIGIQAWGRRL